MAVCVVVMQSYSRDVLSFIFIVLTIVNLWKAVKKYNKGPDLLNRHQTEEWKGWMQVMLLPFVQTTIIFSTLRLG